MEDDLQDRRPAEASGNAGPGALRDRPVDLELVMGSLGCGDLIYELKEQLSRAAPGQAVRVVSNDPGARSEIPAWCRMTGHRLLGKDHPYYLIQVRPGQPTD